MKSEIIEYLKEGQQASVDELATALGKESSKAFSSLVKTISQMERKRQIRFDDNGRIELYEKKKQERLTLKGAITSSLATVFITPRGVITSSTVFS